MKLEMKVDPETKAPIITDGKIVYIDRDDNDRELPLDPVQLYVKVGDLGKENQKHRLKYKDLSEKFSVFKDIEDVSAWKEQADKAIESVANFNEKDWLKAEKVDALKKDINAAWEEKLRVKDNGIVELKVSHEKEKDQLQGQIRKLMVSNRFSQSAFFGENGKTALLPEIAESYFGKYFKVEADTNGEPVTRAYYDEGKGELITSKVNPGEPADFEEAMGLIIEKHPKKNFFIKASGGGPGTGSGTGENENSGDKLSQLQQAHKKAIDEKRAADAITIKNQIYALQRKSA